MMENPQTQQLDETQFVSEVDLFGEGSDFDDDVYKATEVVDDLDQFRDHFVAPNKTQRKSKKDNLLNISHFWHSDLIQQQEDTIKTRKNHYWDFMVYINLKEERFGKYISSIKFLEDELRTAIIKCRDLILSQFSGDEEFQTTELEFTFDDIICKLQSKMRIKSFNLNEVYDPQSNSITSANSVAMINFITSHAEFVKLKRKLYLFREGKNKLVRDCLRRLLICVEEFKTKILSQIYEINSAEFRRCSMTRFLRNLDKITPKADFFGEYRFNLLKCFVNNQDELEKFIQQNILYEIEPEDDHFSTFSNNFTPGTPICDLINYIDFVYDIDQEPGPDDEHDDDDINDLDEMGSQYEMMNFMNANIPDDLISTQIDETQVTEPEVPKENVTEPNNEQYDLDMELLQEARKRAAEILRSCSEDQSPNSFECDCTLGDKSTLAVKGKHYNTDTSKMVTKGHKLSKTNGESANKESKHSITKHKPKSLMNKIKSVMVNGYKVSVKFLKDIINRLKPKSKSKDKNLETSDVTADEKTGEINRSLSADSRSQPNEDDDKGDDAVASGQSTEVQTSQKDKDIVEMCYDDTRGLYECREDIEEEDHTMEDEAQCDLEEGCQEILENPSDKVYGKLEEKSKKLTEITKDLEEKDSEIKETEKDLRQKESELKEKEKNLKDKETELKDAAKNLHEKESEIKETGKDLKETGKDLTETEKDLRQKDSELKEKEKNLKDKETELKDAAKNLHEKESEIKESAPSDLVSEKDTGNIIDIHINHKKKSTATKDKKLKASKSSLHSHSSTVSEATALPTKEQEHNMPTATRHLEITELALNDTKLLEHENIRNLRASRSRARNKRPRNKNVKKASMKKSKKSKGKQNNQKARKTKKSNKNTQKKSKGKDDKELTKTPKNLKSTKESQETDAEKDDQVTTKTKPEKEESVKSKATEEDSRGDAEDADGQDDNDDQDKKFDDIPPKKRKSHSRKKVVIRDDDKKAVLNGPSDSNNVRQCTTVCKYIN
ncbi:hypothetical protein BdWA1_003413 [Babesia duncani]|uniref:Uncharacterized protein n=1 Tax=Babesia duncani TaxID=323732 RepID=A0AAD9PIE3_9APIC|nr:hypothetical protein BdWA1_003413 [Babesia duncani]